MVGRRILLVEGSDDEHVVKNLCGVLGLGIIDEIKPHQNVERLLAAVPVRIKASDQSGDVLGVILDADTNLTGRWHGLRDTLRAAGYPAVPDLPTAEGVILGAVDTPSLPALPRIGVWLMPDNRLPGNLEDYMALLVPPDSPLFGHAKTSLDGIPPAQRRFKDADRSKALIHTWLAWQAEPGRPLGIAIKARFLDPSLPQARVFVDWLKRLYCW